MTTNRSGEYWRQVGVAKKACGAYMAALPENRAAVKSTSTELYIYGAIVDELTRSVYAGYDDTLVSAIWLRDWLASEDAKSAITIRINSPGGFVNEASAMVSLLKDVNVNVKIDGVCASAATLFLNLAKTTEIAEMGSIFLHHAWAGTIGNYRDHERSARDLKQASESLAELYKRKSGLDVDALWEMMDEETFLMAEDAVKMGFADSVMLVEPVEEKEKAKAMLPSEDDLPADESPTITVDEDTATVTPQVCYRPRSYAFSRRYEYRGD